MATSSLSGTASNYTLLRRSETQSRSLLTSPGGGTSIKLFWSKNEAASTYHAARVAAVTRASAREVAVFRGGVVEKEKEKGRVLKVGLICGGPSAERGISLNSARSVLDHLQGDDIHVSCYYIDCNLNAYAISPAQVYSNTPADFDFKLESLAQSFQTLSDLAKHLATAVDIVFPVIHGQFGEDGGIQELLEKYNVPFVGTGSKECCQAFDKETFLGVAWVTLLGSSVLSSPSIFVVMLPRYRLFGRSFGNPRLLVGSNVIQMGLQKVRREKLVAELSFMTIWVVLWVVLLPTWVFPPLLRPSFKGLFMQWILFVLKAGIFCGLSVSLP